MSNKSYFNKKVKYGGITPEQQEQVLKLFYRNELYPGEVRVDNSDPYIAKQLGLPVNKVTWFLNKHLNAKYKR